MIWLLLGVLLFAAVHAVPAAATRARAGVIERIGEGPYKGLFSLGVLVSASIGATRIRAPVPCERRKPHIFAGTTDRSLRRACVPVC